MGFEDAFIGKIDRKRDQEQRNRGTELKAMSERINAQEYNAAHASLTREMVHMEDFADLYGSETIERDRKHVKALEERFAVDGKKEVQQDLTLEDIKKMSEIAEHLLHSGINKYHWMPHCDAIKTSSYDDYVNGVDMIIERQKDSDPVTHLGVGIDITTAKSLDKKLSRIKDEIDAGKLATIKYFKSDKSHMRGELKNLPRLVAALDVQEIGRLARAKRMGIDLKDDPAKLTLISQFSTQLAVYADYARKINSPVLGQIERARAFVDLFVKYYSKDLDKYASRIANDRMVKTLEEGLKEYFGET